MDEESKPRDRLAKVASIRVTIHLLSRARKRFHSRLSLFWNDCVAYVNRKPTRKYPPRGNFLYFLFDLIELN